MRASHSLAYGVFKPVGHVLMALPTEADAGHARAAMLAGRFEASDIESYSPAQMLAQADADLARASTLAGVGQELNLVKSHRELARQGCHFVLARAVDQHAADTLAEIALQCHAVRAQRYGTLLIEELIPVGASDGQVAESNDRGLDAQTTSGRERVGAPR